MNMMQIAVSLFFFFVRCFSLYQIKRENCEAFWTISAQSFEFTPIHWLNESIQFYIFIIKCVQKCFYQIRYVVIWMTVDKRIALVAGHTMKLSYNPTECLNTHTHARTAIIMYSVCMVEWKRFLINYDHSSVMIVL